MGIHFYRNVFHRRLIENFIQIILIEILPIEKSMLNIPDIVTDDEVEIFFTMISSNVKRIREEKGMSQLEVALSIGQKSSGFYANTENYKHKKHFNLLHLLKLSKLFNVPVEEFFKQEER